METCFGCSLTQGKLPIYKVYESENVISFLDYEPFNEGHILILPKQHRQEFTDLTPKEHLEIQKASHLLSNVIKKLVKPDGISILQNGGIFNELMHVHFHVVPRYKHQNFAEFYATSDDQFTPDIHKLQVMQQKFIEVIKLIG
ncbi:HIT family protein [Sporosarcina limicola]|uniref:Diadenosine tetraphosphate (Ap4A) HIT family hydrolase n=1 Tax=Sporosarcina limicola TaxID=34101 RepID=A0A927RH66_9BACL|nr:HIT family protein [Sporosarcina limicola]MBE1557192.1 diadenosine tetraphosphate (Ap4A) HIT family hydrolase [Sporosarcina limicola]